MGRHKNGTANGLGLCFSWHLRDSSDQFYEFTHEPVRSYDDLQNMCINMLGSEREEASAFEAMQLDMYCTYI